MQKARNTEHGQALILIVFGIVAFVGITALAVDGGSVYADRRKAQNAADSAALAGALARINGELWVNTILQSAALNGYNNDGTHNIVEVHSPPTSGHYEGDIEYIQVRITSNVPTAFAAVIGRPQLTNVVEAIARSKFAEYKPIADGAAVVSLAPTSDCDQDKAFWAHAEATLSISGGGVFINSNNSSCALIQQANGSIRIDGGYPIQLVGGYDVGKPRLLTPFPPTRAGPISSPLPFYMPDVGCGAKEAEVSPDGSTMSSGSWGGAFPPKGVSNLEPGVYCLESDFIMDGGTFLSGAGVLIYLKHGQMHITGGVQLNLSAPRSGKYAGLLIYQPAPNQNPLVLNASVDSTVKGTILAPGAEIHFKGNDSKYGFHSQFVGRSINADGNNNIIIRYVQDENYLALYLPVVEFAK